MFRNRAVLAAAVVLGVLGGSVVAAVPAAAAGLTGLEVVSNISALNSQSNRTADVSCPNRKVAISGGGYLTGDAGATRSVHLDTLRPYRIGAGAFRAAASEWAGGFAGNWQLIVFAICADEPPGYEIITAPSPASSNWVHGSIAYCSPGKQVFGFGGSASTVTGFHVALTAVIPAVQLDRVISQAFEEEDGENNTWVSEAYAVCAKPLPGLTVRPETSENDDSAYKAVGFGNACISATLHGFGFGIFSGAGQVWLTAVFPSTDLTAGYAAATVDASGYAGPWYLTGHALCG